MTIDDIEKRVQGKPGMAPYYLTQDVLWLLEYVRGLEEVSKSTTGPAFPQHVCELCSDPVGHMEPKYSGKALRQYFIGQAMIKAPGSFYDLEENAKWAVAYADAVIREMEK